MKCIPVIALVLTLALFALSASPAAAATAASAADDFVFRRVNWGMTIEEVRQSERGLGELGEGSILPEDESGDGDAVILSYISDRLYSSPKTEIYYQFWLEPGAPPPASYPPPLSEARLNGISVMISMPAMGESDPAAAYEKVKAALTVQYGPPREYTDEDGPPETREGNRHYLWTWPDLLVRVILNFEPITGPEILIGIHKVDASAQ